MSHDNARRGPAPPPDPAAIAAFLRALANQVERDPEFGSQVAAALGKSGLLADPNCTSTQPAGAGRARRSSSSHASAAGAGDSAPATTLPDPFALLRAGGEQALRSRLAELEVSLLRQIVRAHRLDPARLSARWTQRERLMALIVEQTRARADHGKAFSRV